MIGLTIAKLLKDSASLLALVNADNIFPIVVNENTRSPWIAYTVDSIESVYEKDGWACDLVHFSILSTSNDYAILQQISTEVRKALQMKSDTGTGRIRMTGFREDYSELYGLFGHQLSFQIRIDKY